jgi:Protein of unknown function (DUF3098)
MSGKVQNKKNDDREVPFAFNKTNYTILIIGLVVMISGFLLMIGGGSDDPDVFSDALFGFRRLTLAPILILTGYIIEIFAIMYRAKQPV